MRTRPRGSEPTDRRIPGDAVSEVIGYMVIFGVISVSIAVVYVNLTPAIDQRQEFEQMKNAEATFTILKNNVDEVVYRDVPERATEIRLVDATVTLEGGPYWLNTTVTPGPPPEFDADDGLGGYSVGNFSQVVPITYEKVDSTIQYENGAVFRGSEGNGSMMHGPGWEFNEDEGIALLTSVATLGEGEVTGRDSVQVRTERESRETRVVTSQEHGDVNVTMTMYTPHGRAWEGYLSSEHDGYEVNTSGGPQAYDEVSVTVDVGDTKTYQTVVLSEYVIGAEIS